ncbi:hypothetical protein L9F63_009096 [Diploptera punctata]|uniref:RIIa domain-containing protein n=1 Tax=Diploptera punctata TaxID=6984 RepID=A0AAD7Z483_DIPPU|nr:hypothetical protein L9F63_009096 [Diploptera punctata]
MVDNSTPSDIPFKNHPLRNPHGMLDYEYGVLTVSQQRALDTLKTNTIQENHIYLASHPEVRAIVCLLLRAFYNRKPNNVPEFARKFVMQPNFEDMVKEYLIQHEKKTSFVEVSDGNKNVSILNGIFPSSIPCISGDALKKIPTSSVTKKDKLSFDSSENAHLEESKPVKNSEESVSSVLEEILKNVNSFIQSKESSSSIVNEDDYY